MDSFADSLLKEKNGTNRAKINAFYELVFPAYEVTIIDYDAHEYGKFLQASGVDTVLTKYNKYGSIDKQIYIQEKIIQNKYKKMMFEYKKASGNAGWATCPREKADLLLYFMNGDIYLMNFRQMRKYIVNNLDSLIQQGYYKTDNYNVNVPITQLQEHFMIQKYEEEKYWK